MAQTAASTFGTYPRICPICSFEGHFLAEGFPVRLDCLCPSCESVERHRLFKLWLDINGDKVANRRVLHFAPEAAVSRFVQQKASTYVTADIRPGAADIVLNLHSLNLPDQSYDFVICSHVLEHVDDRKALSELFRAITPGGMLVLMFPIVEGWDQTYENSSVQSSAARLLHFGQKDHVRYFGRDVRNRISAAGFCLQEFAAIEPLVHRHGLLRGEKIFLATKPKA
jgi:SAM-dependent methyltransferase